MKTPKTISVILGQILAVILILFCFLILIRLTTSSIQIGRGYVEVNMIGGERSEPVLLNGETPRSAGHYYTLSEQLYLEAPNGIAPAVRVGCL